MRAAQAFPSSSSAKWSKPPQRVEASAQRVALDALLQAVTPEALVLPPSARRAIPPRPPGYGANRELFDGYTGLPFDPYAPAETAAQLTLDQLLVPERMACLTYQQDFEAAQPGLSKILRAVTAHVWQRPSPEDAYRASLQRVVQETWTDALLDAAQAQKLASPVRAHLTAELQAIERWLADHPGADRSHQAHRTLLHRRIARYLNRPFRPETDRTQPLTVPPGSPIGGGSAGERRW